MTVAPCAGKRNILFECVVLLNARTQAILKKTRLALRKQRIELVFHARARPQNEMAAVAHIFEQMLRKVLRNHIQARRNHQLVIRERSIGAHHIDRLRKPAQIVVITIQDGYIVVFLGVFLKLDGPVAVVRKQ